MKEEFEKLLKPFHPFDIKYIAPYKENCQNSYIATIIDNENSNSIIKDICKKIMHSELIKIHMNLIFGYDYCQIIDHDDRYNIFCGSV